MIISSKYIFVTWHAAYVLMITDVFFVGNLTLFQDNLNTTDLLDNPVFTNVSCSKNGEGDVCEFGLENSFQV